MANPFKFNIKIEKEMFNNFKNSIKKYNRYYSINTKHIVAAVAAVAVISSVTVYTANSLKEAQYTIQNVTNEKLELEQQKAELEQQKAELEQQNEQYSTQLDELSQKADNIESKVKELEGAREELYKKLEDISDLGTKFEAYTAAAEYDNAVAMFSAASYESSEKTPVDVSQKLEILEKDTEKVQEAYIAAENHVIETVAYFDSIPDIWPVKGEISCDYNYKNSESYVEGSAAIHKGIDMRMPAGTPVKAAAAGKVIASGYTQGYSGYGIVVVVDHGNGYTTLYAHNSDTAVEVGDTVEKGQVICYSGSTGMSTGQHLHYEILLNGEPLDPVEFIK